MPESSRQIALKIVSQVLKNRQPLDEVFNALVPALPEQERAFTRQLVASMFRNLGHIDAILDICLAKPLPKKCVHIQHILRLGVTQLLYLRVPDHAAVAESMNLLTPKDDPFRGLVNAVLRRVAKDPEAFTDITSKPEKNVPHWIWQSWSKHYGVEQARAIISAQMTDPPLDITVNGNPMKWMEELEAAKMPNGTLRRRKAGQVAQLPGYDEGAWWVQDMAAALPVHFLGDLQGKKVLDLCAAPGGKTAQLVARGADVMAIDKSASRIARLQENLARLNLKADVEQADILMWQPGKKFDAILLDAPCTATGTVRRHPEALWIKSPEDITEMVRIQQGILKKAVDWLRPGGVLIYCVCSLQPEEEGHVKGLPLIPVPFKSKDVFSMRALVNEYGQIRTLPCHLLDKGGMDGFFIRKYVKR
jgi:16S rRNA (cytosine967-C5)-methyltransferase